MKAARPSLRHYKCIQFRDTIAAFVLYSTDEKHVLHEKPHENIAFCSDDKTVLHQHSMGGNRVTILGWTVQGYN